MTVIPWSNCLHLLDHPPSEAGATPVTWTSQADGPKLTRQLRCPGSTGCNFSWQNPCKTCHDYRKIFQDIKYQKQEQKALKHRFHWNNDHDILWRHKQFRGCQPWRQLSSHLTKARTRFPKIYTTLLIIMKKDEKKKNKTFFSILSSITPMWCVLLLRLREAACVFGLCVFQPGCHEFHGRPSERYDWQFMTSLHDTLLQYLICRLHFHTAVKSPTG